MIFDAKCVAIKVVSQSNKEVASIDLIEKKPERISYSVPNMPVRACLLRQEDYPLLSVVNHWHDDFEFSYVQKGSMNYYVDGECCEITEGQMIFVNSDRMHYGFWNKKCECEFISSIFHPSLLDKKLSQKYLDCITNEKAPSFIIFHSEVLREKKIIDLALKLYENVIQSDDGFEFGIMSCIYELSQQLLKMIKTTPDAVQANNKHLEAMRRMVGFIQQKYTEKIMLTDIASAGFVSRSVCYEIFRKYLNKSPLEYLTEYRIFKSMEYLSEKNLTVAEISSLCGFSGASYFTETFRKIMRCTPTEYRQKRT